MGLLMSIGRRFIAIILLSVLTFSLWGVKSFQTSSVPPPPPPPVSRYIWVDSGTNFYSVKYLGVNYSAGIVVGAYLPPDVSLDKRYDLYFYVTQDHAVTWSPIPTKVIIGVCIGVGFGLTTAGKGVFLRLSVLWQDDEALNKTWLVYLYDPPQMYLVSSSPEIVYNTFGDIPTGRWDGPFVGVVKVSTIPEKGTSRIILDASPTPGYVGKPVRIFGVLYGSWRCISGIVAGKPVEIRTGWGFRAVVTTNGRGEFSINTTTPPTVYSPPVMFSITATFYEDEDLTGTFTTVQYQVLAKVETTLSLSHSRIQYGMGMATRFYGYLKEKDSGAPVAGKTIQLTTLGGGNAWTYSLTTNSAGYYELAYTSDSGIFNWAEASFNGDDPYLPSFSGRIYP